MGGLGLDLEKWSCLHHSRKLYADRELLKMTAMKSSIALWYNILQLLFTNKVA